MAAASLGRLTLDLVARIGSFTEPMTRAERQARNSSNNIADGFSVATVAATALGAAVAGISVGGLVAFANQTIQTGSDIKKFAQLANTTFRDFQYYAKGAETAGISMESFADKMKDMQDRIGDFHQSGGGPLADFFENIAPLVGVTIQQFQKLSGPEALQLYYNSLKKVGATQNDMKFYMEAIISDSSLLLPLLENGGAGFKKYGDAAERANAILSDDMIQSLALAKENVWLLNLQWEGLQATFVNAVIPVIHTVSDNMDNVKAVALALTAAIATKLVIQGAILAGTFTMAAIRAGVMEVSLMALQGRATGTAASMGILRGAMAFLGGPAGLAMLAVQGIAAGAAFLYMKKSSDSLDPSLSTQGKSIAELTAEYEKLDATQKRVLTRKATDELNEANKVYREQKNELLGLIDAVTRNSKVSEKDRGAAAQLFEQYRQGKISSNELATAVNSLATVSDAAKSSIDKKAEAVGKESDTVSNAQSILDVYNGKVKENTKTNRENARSISDQASALSLLTQRQREALKDIQDQVAKANYVDANMAAGWSRERAEYFADYRQNAGLSFTGASLSAQEIKQVEAGYKLQQQTKAREESEKKIEESNRKQVESQEKLNKLVGASALSGLRIKSAESIAGGQIRAYTADFAQLAQKQLGDELKRFTAFNDTYHKGTNSKHATGNAFDFTIADSAKSAETVAELKKLAKSYGFVIRVLDEYKQKSSRATGGHLHVSVLGYKGNAEAVSDAKAAVELVKDTEAEIEEEKKQAEERRKSVMQIYFTEEEQMAEDNKEKLLLIQKAFAGDQTAIKEYTEKQKIAYQEDVENYRRAQKEKFDASKNDLLGQLANAEDAISLFGVASKYGKNSLQYQNASLSITSKQAKSAEFDRYTSSVTQIGNEYGAPDEVEKRYELIELAKKLHLENMKALDADYLASTKQMALDQYQQQLDMWQGLLSNGQNTFSQLTQSVKDSAGEQSGSYRTMFAMQQAFSVASSVVAAWTAYTQAFADPSAMTLPQKFAGGMAVMTALVPALATISSMAIQGFATGGLITGKGTGTSDEIPIMASNREFMFRAAAVEKLGLANLYYMNRTGELPRAYAEGGAIALDAPKVLNMQSPKMSGYMQQAQATQAQTIDNQIRVAIFDDRDDMMNQMYGKQGEKVVMYHLKRNGMLKA